jgi:protocatechuate 3,4-dioxygenase beta subunit
MLRSFVGIAIVAAVWPLAAQAPPRDTASPSGTAVIRGRVMAVGDDRPLAKVQVRVFSSALKIDNATLTDANGRYEFTGLAAGRYTIACSKANFVRASYGQRRPLGPGLPIDVANGQVVTRIDVALRRTGVVSGRVVDEFGDPAVGALVMPMRYQFINGERRLQQSGRGAPTNDIGEYRIYGLMPGRYFIAATTNRFASGESNDRTAYAPTYYPGTGNVAEAQRLMVTAGQTITSINLSLLPVTAAHISGVALDAQGRPLAGAYVNLARRLGFGMFGGSTQVRADGSFALGGVTPGDYKLRASVPGIQDEVATAEVTVNGGDVTDIQLGLTKASTLRGRIVFERGDAKPPQASAIRVNAFHPDSMTAMGGFANAKDDSTFEVKPSAGRVLIRAGIFGTGEWRLKRIVTADGVDVTDAGLDVAANATIDGIVVELTSRHSEVSGSVTDAGGARIRDCVVVAFAQDQQRWTAQTRYFGTSRPDVDNTFRLRLPAGDYYAAAFEELETLVSYNDPDVLQQLRDRAITFTIADGEKKTLSLTLSAPPVF